MYADNLSGLENCLAPSWWQTIIWSIDNLIEPMLDYC